MYTRRLVQALAALPDIASDQVLLLEAARSRSPLTAGVKRGRVFTPSHHPWEQLLLPLELARHRLDVLHSPDYIPPFARNCRSVVTIHDLAFLRWPELLTPDSRAYFNGHIERAVASAEAIIAVSQATKQDLVDLLGVSPDKVRVIYEAAGFDATSDPPRENMPEDYVLFVGTFEPRKNLPRLIEAFARVRERGYKGKLVLAGTPGWLAKEALDAVERHSADVLVRGVDPRVYGPARALALPSLYEGFGLPLLEAMSNGVPVLTSNVSSLPEIAGDAALLVDPLDVDAIADGLWQLLTDSELGSRLAARGRARAAEFSWERAARETLDVYHSLA